MRLIALLLLFPLTVVAEEAPVRVFILAGQSNMEGKAKNSLFDYQAQQPATQEHFAHLRKDGKWIVRDDVFIKFLDRHGRLTLGYGSPDRTGCELELGTLLGDHFAEPVLLIKTAWGGHSLCKMFRSPSAGLPPDAQLEEELRKAREQVQKNNETRKRNDPLPTLEELKAGYGSSYRQMLAEVRETLANAGTLFPELKDRRLELTGFVWFQSWNDLFGGQDEYASNLRHLIRDVRQDLQAPQLPFVIAVMGQNGSQPAKGAMLTIQQAQLSMETLPEFQGNVKAVRTDLLVDKAAEELYPTWRENVAEWEKRGSDFGFHYLGSAIWFTRIGHELGVALLQLLPKEPAAPQPVP